MDEQFTNVRNENGEQQPIINCHTHIFTKDHVPPYLAKTIIPAPLYRLVNLNFFFRIFHWWYSNKGPAGLRFKPWYKRWARRLYRIRMFLARHYVWGALYMLAGILVTAQVFFSIWNWAGHPSEKDNTWIERKINWLYNWLCDHHLLWYGNCLWLKLLFILLLIVFFPSGRSFIIFCLKKMYSFLGKLPGKQTKEMFKRYLTIGRFTFQKGQGTVLGELERQYPQGTGFIILPMDMEYMDAGKVKEGYRQQMEKIAGLKAELKDSKPKHHIYPFVFADPRRIAKEEDYFRFTAAEGKVELQDCFIKTYIEDYRFSGFKIYPALGYYPFDELLLALWKYAADNGIPVLTHCVRGPMYFRGAKKKEWDFHPIFEQAMGDKNYDPLLLPEKKNTDFSANFTHPMNFLCLLEEELLRKWIHKIISYTPGSPLKQIFGYTNENTRLKYDLRNLKICFGHYGGDDEWKRYFEQDRYGFSNQLTIHPYSGIDFLLTEKNELSPGKPEQLWKYADWYSLISSMMLQYPDVYADISFILHNDTLILPLLKQTLQNHELRKKVLYGTDFYVVRNLKSDKQMLADMTGGLDEADFDQIARINPAKFLSGNDY